MIIFDAPLLISERAISLLRASCAQIWQAQHETNSEELETSEIIT